MLFAAGLFVSGAFGGISPLGLTSTGDTGTGTSAVSSTNTGTSTTASTDTSWAPTTTDTGSTASGTTSTASSTTTTTSQTASPVPYIVTFNSGVSDAQQRADIAAANGTPGDAIAPLHMYSLTFPAGEDSTDARRSQQIPMSPR